MPVAIINEERFEEFKKDWLAGMLREDMAVKYGYGSGNAVSHAALNRFKLPPRRGVKRPPKKVDHEAFKRDWLDTSMTVLEVAQKHGWGGRESARLLARQLGLSRKVFDPEARRETEDTLEGGSWQMVKGVKKWVSDE